jgi:nucleotide-binding universal stress UspA family protein
MQALERAADVAERFGSSLILLHVIAAQAGVHAVAQHVGARAVVPDIREKEGEGPEISDEEVETAIGQQREKAYAALQAFLPPRIAKYPCELRVIFGRPFERIVETAVKEKVDLIILGTHGRTGLARLAMGSVAERVVRLAPCPVLTVKAQTPESESWLQDFYASFMGDSD